MTRMGRALASVLDIRLHRGSAFYQCIRLRKQTGEPYDLTDKTVILKVARRWSDDYSIFEKTGEIIGDATDGEVAFTFVPADTENLSVTAYDITIWIDDLVAFQGRLGVLPSNPEVEV